MTKDTWWVYLLGILISSGAVASIFSQAKHFKRVREIKKIGNGYRSLKEVLATMHEIIQETEAVRVTIVASHNGGGRPSPVTQVKTTVLYEEAHAHIPRIGRDWDGVPVDNLYTHILVNLLDHGEYKINTEDMPEGLLKTRLLADGIQHLEAYSLGASSGAVFFMNVGFEEAGSEIANRSRDILRYCSARIQHIYQDLPGIFEDVLS